MRISIASLGMSAYTSPGMRHRYPQNPEVVTSRQTNTTLPPQTRGGVITSAACLAMNACTPSGLRLTNWEGVVVLKELIFNGFYFGQVW